MGCGLCPWIAYWATVGSVPFRTAVLIALGVSAIVVGLGVVRHQFHTLEIGTLIAFAILTVLAFSTNDDFLETWLQPLTSGALLVIALASILIGRPFTLEYARAVTTPEEQAQPGFAYISRMIAWVWVAAFAVMTVSCLIPPIVQGDATVRDGASVLAIVFYWVIPFIALGLAFINSIRFPDWFVGRIDAMSNVPDPGSVSAREPEPAELTSDAGLTLHVEPADSTVDTAPSVTVTGAEPGTVVTLTSRLTDARGARWEAETRITAGPDGTAGPLEDGGALVSTMLPKDGDFLYLPPIEPQDLWSPRRSADER